MDGGVCRGIMDEDKCRFVELSRLDTSVRDKEVKGK